MTCIHAAVRIIVFFVAASLLLPPAAAEQLDERSLESKAGSLFEAGQYGEALSVARQWVQVAEREESTKGRPGPETAHALTAVAWYALFARSPEEAIAASERAMALRPWETEIEINRAHALLFLGRTDAAQAIYLSHKGKTLSDKTKWEQVIAKDFGDFRQRGFALPAMDTVETALAAAPDSPDVLGERATDLMKQGKYSDALSTTRNYGDAVRTRYGEKHTEYAAVLSLQAQIHVATKQPREAEELYRQALAINEESAGKESRAVVLNLLGLVQLLTTEQKLGDAEPLLRRALGILEKQPGPDHPLISSPLNALAELLLMAERADEAEFICRRALSITEKAVGADHQDIALHLDLLARILVQQRHFAEAETLYRRALTVRETARDEAGAAESLAGLARVLEMSFHFSEAEKLYRRSIELTEKSLGSEHPMLANRIGMLGHMLAQISRNADAEALFRRALALDEKIHGPDHPAVASRLNSLGQLLLKTNQLPDAETAIRRAVAINEAAHGPDHPDVVTSYYSLATLLYKLNRPAEAEPLFRHAIAMTEKASATGGIDEAVGLNNLALVLIEAKRYTEAEPLLQRAITILEQSHGRDHPLTASAYNNLAVVLNRTDRTAEAETLIRRGLAIQERVYGPDHPSVALTLNNLARTLQDVGKRQEAEVLYERAHGILERSFGSEHPDVATSLVNSASVKAEQQDWRSALDLMRRASSIQIASARQMRGSVGGAEKRLLTQSLQTFRDFVLYAYRTNSTDVAFRDEAYIMAQRALMSDAADALARSSARFAAGRGPLADLVREQQDLLRLREEADNRMLAALAEADKAGGAAERAELEKINAKFDAIAKRLAVEFPEYATLANPEPLTIAATQALLNPDEALFVFLDVAKNGSVQETGFAWLITRNDAKWVEIPAGTTALAEHVTALRCGLTHSAWEGNGAAQCDRLMGGDFANSPFPPFDIARAHQLYSTLFGQFSEQINGKHLLIAPSGALTALPPQVLITELPASESTRFSVSSYVGVKWLGRSNAITILPSVASLAGLRKSDRRPPAEEPFIGFGNPVLTGGKYCGEIHVPTRCPGEEVVAEQSQPRSATGWVVASVGQLFRGGVANPGQVRKMCPLPDTAHELKCVARSLGARPSRVIVGAAATESAVKSTDLSRYRVIHFATHGLLSNETAELNGGLPEPALVLTPPDEPTENDDGLLTASEVTQLKLNADWVVLSACNTAGSAQPGGEALSGLARAFFYAGARTLLLSHWPVDSNAATMLTSTAFKEQRDNPGLSPAEAMRRAAIALMDDRQHPWNAHPAIWAPFVVVGGN